MSWRHGGSTSMDTRRAPGNPGIPAHGFLRHGHRRISAARASAAARSHAGRIHYRAPRLQTLRYGENPHQQAALYSWGGYGLHVWQETGYRVPKRIPTSRIRQGPAARAVEQVPTVAGARMLHGKELSFNNLMDLDAALNCVASFTVPAAVIIKHTNPCGLACADSLVEAYRHAHSGDPVSAYGGSWASIEKWIETRQPSWPQCSMKRSSRPDTARRRWKFSLERKTSGCSSTGTPIGPDAVYSDTEIRIDWIFAGSVADAHSNAGFANGPRHPV